MSDVAYTVMLNYAKDNFTQQMIAQTVTYDLTESSASSGALVLVEDVPQMWPVGDVDTMGRLVVKNLDSAAVVHVGEWLDGGSGDGSGDGSAAGYFATWSTVSPGHVVMLEPPSVPHLLAVGGSPRIIFATLPV